MGAPEGGGLDLRGVWFAYPSRPEAWVLQGMDLRVAPGQRVSETLLGVCVCAFECC